MEKAVCTVKALVASTGMDYEIAASIAAEAGRGKGRRFSAKKIISRAKMHGFGFRKLRFGTRTLRKFIRENPAGAFYVVKRGHAFAVVDGIPSETWQSDNVIIKSAWLSTFTQPSAQAAA